MLAINAGNLSEQLPNHELPESRSPGADDKQVATTLAAGATPFVQETPCQATGGLPHGIDRVDGVTGER